MAGPRHPPQNRTSPRCPRAASAWQLLAAFLAAAWDACGASRGAEAGGGSSATASPP
eukprot:CAMPEP_0173463194 /NCGR_PEP_ID=MMETSP1357-20121228/67950_1 /TAXON_ID=77926 /ORGANISM="Hemiselmis rufescens, Strain PCC563" /LENGTH=56 /DNA_ID=CAMNT_0014430993 /DNA_START=54 /DNA_END=220 /DNA_ORIENTATION=-